MNIEKLVTVLPMMATCSNMLNKNTMFCPPSDILKKNPMENSYSALSREVGRLGAFEILTRPYQAISKDRSCIQVKPPATSYLE